MFPRGFQLPIPLGLNLLLMPGERVLWRDVADGTIQTGGAEAVAFSAAKHAELSEDELAWWLLG